MLSITDKASSLSSPSDKVDLTGATGSFFSVSDKPWDKMTKTDTASSAGGVSFKMTPSIINVNYPATATKYNKYQVDFDFQYKDVYDPAAPVDPAVFDPNQIDISIVFKKVGGAFARKRQMPAFFMVDYNRNTGAYDPTGYVLGQPINSPDTFRDHDRYEEDLGYLTPKYHPSHAPGLQRDPTPWHVRFAPPETGDWSFHFVVVLSGDTAHPLFFPGGSFRVIDSSNKGYVKAVERNFRFDNGDLFYPVGVHANWDGGWYRYNRIPYMHARFIMNKIAENGGNHCRLFMNFEKFGFEHEVVNNYATYSRQERAFDLDALVEHAGHIGVYMQLVLDERLELLITSLWRHGPYFLTESDPKKFWTNKTVKRYYRNKLRYIIARWGYSTNVFAFEFMNEISMAHGYYWWHGIEDTDENPRDPLTGKPTRGAKIVSNWLNEMIDYCKQRLGDTHMYAASTAGRDSEANAANDDEAPLSFLRKTKLDFYTDHVYLTSIFQDHRINYMANRARYLYPDKPYIIGEFGMNSCSASACEYMKTNTDIEKALKQACIDTQCATCEIWGTGVLPGVDFKDFGQSEFHNALFTSALSGCSGTITNWADHTNTIWGGQIKYIRSFINFLRGEDMNLGNSVAIRNACCIEDRCVPSEFRGEGLPTKIFNSDVCVNNADVEVFALKYVKGSSKNKIIGWVRNCNNWWFNLPHHYDADGSPFCKNPSPRVEPLSGVTLEIDNVWCNATYRVDFYGVYTNWPLTNGGPPSDGGKIFSSIIVSANCGKLKFAVPTMPPISPGNAPFAPDYGFKITPIVKGWGHGFVGNLAAPSGGIQPFAVTGNGVQVAYRGGDGTLMCWYRAHAGSYDWMLAPIAPGGYRGVQKSGSIARGATSGQVYYHGADDRLQVAYWDGSGWAHTHLTDWGNTSQNVGGDIGCNSAGGKIFYRGADGQLHMYLFYSGAWHHSVHWLPTMKRPATDANFAVSGDGNFLAFKGRDETLVFVWYDHVTGMYQNDLHSTDSVTGLVRMNSAGNVLFFRGPGGGLYQVYYESGWRRRLLYTDWGAARVPRIFDINPTGGKDDAQVYFRGDDGVMQVIYQDGLRYVQAPIIACMPEQGSKLCREGGYIRYAGGMVVYNSVNPSGIRHRFDSDKNLQAYYFGKCDLD